MAYHEDIEDGLITIAGKRYEDGRIGQGEENLCIEEVVHLLLNDEPVAHLVASPLMLAELGAGFVITEGLADTVDAVRVDGATVRVTGHRLSGTPARVTESGGGLSAAQIVRKIDADLTITAADVFAVIEGIVSDLWRRTGGAHCSVLYRQGEILAKASDVGRHNTVDKVVGQALLGGIDPGTCVLGCTGRQPYGMVAKAVNAGIPIVVTKAAATHRGVVAADQAGLTLVCRVKDGRFCVYTHPWRIRELRARDAE